MPRRLAKSISRVTATVMDTVYGTRVGYADVSAAVPADVCTATVTV